MRQALPFNPKNTTKLHIDLNSCFASIEQLSDPHLRGKPIVVAAYDSPRGCVVAPSIEAKQLGIKTGMRVQDAKMLCRDLTVLLPDPPRYRSIHLKLKKLLLQYTDLVTAKSIDEFVLDLEGYPALRQGIYSVAQEIKQRIRSEVGESLTVSIGIAANRFLSKLAASLHKPDGLFQINPENYLEVYRKIQLTDLCGIKERNALRLNAQGIFSALDFYRADVKMLRAAFESIVGYWWYLRLRGWEIDDVDFGRHSFGNSFALPTHESKIEAIAPILQKLVTKTCERMRKGAYACRGVHVAVTYRDGDHWHRGISTNRDLIDTREIYQIAARLLQNSPYRKPVSAIAESVFNLRKIESQQLSLFEDVEQVLCLNKTVDSINHKWGNYVITPARMLQAGNLVQDRVSFGNIQELQEAICNDDSEAL